MDIQSSGSASDDNRKNSFMEAESPREKDDIFYHILNLNIQKNEEPHYSYHQVQTQRRYNKRNNFKKILNSSSSNERLIPSSPKNGSSRQNSERVRNIFQTQNSMDQESFRKNFKKRQEESFSVSNTIRDSSSSFSEHSDSKSLKHILPPEYRDQSPMDEEKKFTCNCKRSKCLKLYCQCFQRQLFCNENCNCHDCGNRIENSQKHKKAVIEALGRNARGFEDEKRGQVKEWTERQGFSLGFEIESVKKGCKCRKTRCLKKYCECYQSGVKCGVFCRCEDCLNTVFHEKKM